MSPDRLIPPVCSLLENIAIQTSQKKLRRGFGREKKETDTGNTDGVHVEIVANWWSSEPSAPRGHLRDPSTVRVVVYDPGEIQ
ncbi:unnamed protein product [Musa acuminata subsp. burmannicoides]